MWMQFSLENVHFAINLFGTLALFCIFWLHWDAWTDKKNFRGLFSILGFILLSIAFLVKATVLESTILVSPLFGNYFSVGIVYVLKSAGYLFLVAGILANPISRRPSNELKAIVLAPLLVGAFTQPILAGLVGYLYMRRATVGLEHHLKRIGVAFFIISVSELLSLSSLLRDTTNVQLYNLAAPFGPIWMLENALLFMAFILLARWGFFYLFKRFETQLFMIFTSVILVIFLTTTVSFTALLLKNIQEVAVNNIRNNAKILLFNLESKQAETLSDAQVLANNPTIQTLIQDEDKKALRDITEKFLLSKKESSLLVLNKDGVVISRGEDREKVGDSLSSDPLVRRSLLGEEVSSITTSEGVLAPLVSVVSVSPIKNEKDQVQGVVMATNLIDSAFLDNIKSATGFEVGIYGGDSLSASSIKPYSNSNDRPTGIKESNELVLEQVLKKGGEFVGTTEFLNSTYLSSYLPLKDRDNATVGMLFVGSPEVTLLKTASRSIELTFIVTVLLLVISIIPSYLISKYISDQLT